MNIHLPTCNAFFNFCAACCLVMGWRAIAKGRREEHQRWMIAALVASATFLTSYLIYHYTTHAVTRYPHHDWRRWVYFTILLTHTPLAMVVLPACIMAVWHAIKKRYDRHTRITRWLMPVWMYVSVTGVLIYLMLYVFV